MLDEDRLLITIKRKAGIQDEEWDSPSLEEGFSRLYVIGRLQDYLMELCSYWKYRFLQAKYTSDSTNSKTKLTVVGASKYIILNEDIAQIELFKVGTDDLTVLSLLELEEEEITDGGTDRYGYEYQDPDTGQTKIMLLGTIPSTTVVKAIVLRYPEIKFFPPEFFNLFLYVMTEEIMLEKQKSNLDAAKAEYEKKRKELEEKISDRWAGFNKSRLNKVIRTPFAPKMGYRSGRRLSK